MIEVAPGCSEIFKKRHVFSQSSRIAVRDEVEGIIHALITSTPEMIMKHIATLTLNSAATSTLRKGMTALLIAGVCGSALTTARAASYTFDANTSTRTPGRGGHWNTTLSNFWNGTSDVKWPNQDTTWRSSAQVEIQAL